MGAIKKKTTTSANTIKDFANKPTLLKRLLMYSMYSLCQYFLSESACVMLQANMNTHT